VSIDDNRPTLKGSLIEFTDGEVNIVSLDGYRIAHRKYYLMQESKPFKAIIPGKTLNEIMKILGQGEENVNIYLSDNQILFETGKCKVISRLLEGEFLNYRNFIPKEYETRIKINCKFLLSSIERASLLTREDKRYPIRFDIEDERIIISSSTEMGDVRDEITIEMSGKKIEIGFNPKFFIDALRIIDDEEIFVEFTSNVGPCTIKPIEGDTFSYMILPVRR
jgi:DNA polymerase-3 subunit beta